MKHCSLSTYGVVLLPPVKVGCTYGWVGLAVELRETFFVQTDIITATELPQLRRIRAKISPLGHLIAHGAAYASRIAMHRHAWAGENLQDQVMRTDIKAVSEACSRLHDRIHLAKMKSPQPPPPIKIRAFCLRDTAPATKTPPLAVREIQICSFIAGTDHLQDA